MFFNDAHVDFLHKVAEGIKDVVRVTTFPKNPNRRILYSIPRFIDNQPARLYVANRFSISEESATRLIGILNFSEAIQPSAGHRFVIGTPTDELPTVFTDKENIVFEVYGERVLRVVDPDDEKSSLDIFRANDGRNVFVYTRAGRDIKSQLTGIENLVTIVTVHEDVEELFSYLSKMVTTRFHATCIEAFHNEVYDTKKRPVSNLNKDYKHLQERYSPAPDVVYAAYVINK